MKNFMAKKEAIATKFRFTYAELKQKADNTLLLIDRDIAEFNNYGFTPAKRTELEAAIESFANFPTDMQMEGMQIAATDARDEARNALESKMRSILLAVKNTFGENTATYRGFGKSNLSRQYDDELIRNAKDMIAETQEYLAELEAEGITLAKVTQLEDAKNTFDIAIDAQRKTVKNRDKATEKRILLANTLYDLIARYNETGKTIWYEVSESKHNDYIIYDTPTGKPE